MKVAVTGVAGFVGINLTAYALAQGAAVVGYDINDGFGRLAHSGIIRHSNFTFVQSDISIEPISIDQTVTHVVHLAALAQVDFSMQKPEFVIANNINSTLSVLRALRAAPRPAIFTSSVEVYGGADHQIYVETDVPRPLSPYALSKTCCEDICRLFAKSYQTPLTILRLTNLFGPWQSPDRVIPRTIARRLYKLPLAADERRTRDFLHVTQAVRAIWLVLGSKTPLGTLNISTGIATPIRDVVSKIGHDSKIRLLSELHSSGRGPGLTSSPALAKRVLQWKPKTNFNQELKETVDWYSSHLDWLSQFQREIYSELGPTFLVDTRRF